MTDHEIIMKRSAELFLLTDGLSLSDCEDFIIRILLDKLNAE